MEIEGFAQGPPVFEAMESARCHDGGERTPGVNVGMVGAMFANAGPRFIIDRRAQAGQSLVFIELGGGVIQTNGLLQRTFDSGIDRQQHRATEFIDAWAKGS